MGHNELCTLEISHDYDTSDFINYMIKNGYSVLIEPIWESDKTVSEHKVLCTIIDKAVK